MVKPETVKAGDTLYSVHRYKRAGVKGSALGCWPVRVLSVDADQQTAMCSYNSNPPRLYTFRQLSKLRRNPLKLGT